MNQDTQEKKQAADAAENHYNDIQPGMQAIVDKHQDSLGGEEDKLSAIQKEKDALQEIEDPLQKN